MSNMRTLEAPVGLAVQFRALSAADGEAYKAIRLKALETEGRYFTASYEDEVKRTPKEWAAVCAETTKRVTYGAFADNKLVAVSSAIEVSPTTVKWGSTYTDPQFRQTHITETLYKMREHWSELNGYDEAVFTIRADNERSRGIHEKNGAVATREAPMRFADGSTANTVFYRRQLSA